MNDDSVKRHPRRRWLLGLEALALLTLGDYRRGFEKYEWRWRRSGMDAQKSRGRPLWLGDYPLARKTVLLHAEQGFGDTIQFVRYVPMLAASGAKVVLEVQPELAQSLLFEYISMTPKLAEAVVQLVI